MGLQDDLVDEDTDGLSLVPNAGTELMWVADQYISLFSLWVVSLRYLVIVAEI